ncbi:MAG: glutathione S-transferase N-terminal domain-containing protein [Brevundimonas sp.]|uniref:glutathione S-transferase N-terminal domain-containing protein n=1 Tax=Brevundimonas sp. TaxID=1871086 RepID=UPI00273543C1|nr:glutathione S-transferase N-terminal domain-containing protein [Brevundimonas sp.]MDP3404126.1 glutathione S-transferase N-terminal domain-containing protein [Brevundimonas sp.]
MSQPYVLYGMPVSMFAGKARAHLRKRRVPFVERLISHPRFVGDVAPAIGRLIIPVLETPEGELIQDTADILRHVEWTFPGEVSIYPSTPRHSVIARIFELFGDEGMIRVAMHYRWNYPDQNMGFLRAAFAAGIAPGADAADAEAVAGGVMAKLQTYLPALGLSPQTIPAVEAGYEALLDALNRHFQRSPYLLGGVPCVGDFGLIAAFHAHLARDPYPADQMRTRAYFVWRWVERMISADADMPEFPDTAEAYAADDQLAPTLGPVLEAVGRIYGAELMAQVAGLNAWLADHPDLAAGEPLQSADREKRPRGTVSFDLSGTQMTTALRAFSVFKLQAVTDDFDGLTAADQATVTAALDPFGLAPWLTLKAGRRIARVDNREVWGDPSS